MLPKEESAKTVRSQRRRRLGALIAIAGTVGFAVGFAVPAAAGTAYSSLGYYTVGVQYVNQAIIQTSSSFAQARTTVGKSSGAASATGDVGARGRLFIGGSTTNMSCESTTQYNPYAVVTWLVYSCQRNTSGTWNSYGVTYSWNGSGYSPSYTYNSPSQNS